VTANPVSTPFVGDFSSLALAFQLPMPARYGAGLVVAVAFLLSVSVAVISVVRAVRPAINPPATAGGSDRPTTGATKLLRSACGEFLTAPIPLRNIPRMPRSST
jgi:hypothetical protein